MPHSPVQCPMFKLVLVACLLVAVSAQIPIPSRYDGFAQGSPASPVLFEMIGDLLCSDCLTAWPNVKSVVAYYNQPNQPSNLRFVFHTFPLPYHHYAYASAQGASIVKALAPSRVFDWIDAVYANQATFYNEATAGMTSDQVNLVFAKLANTSCGVDPSAYLDLLQNYTVSDQPVRISFKYAASRAVVGTPTFWVNGIPVNGDPTWGVAEWRQIIDPLLPGTMEHELAAAFTTAPLQCPPTTKSCQFLPGKFECCTPGENCIPNVGCRC